MLKGKGGTYNNIPYSHMKLYKYRLIYSMGVQKAKAEKAELLPIRLKDDLLAKTCYFFFKHILFITYFYSFFTLNLNNK